MAGKNTAKASKKHTSGKPAVNGGLTPAQREWLERGLEQPGGKLPLFDGFGQRIDERTVKSCLEHGWVEPWFSNPIKPDWLICKLTDTGRKALA